MNEKATHNSLPDDLRALQDPQSPAVLQEELGKLSSGASGSGFPASTPALDLSRRPTGPRLSLTCAPRCCTCTGPGCPAKHILCQCPTCFHSFLKEFSKRKAYFSKGISDSKGAEPFCRSQPKANLLPAEALDRSIIR